MTKEDVLSLIQDLEDAGPEGDDLESQKMSAVLRVVTARATRLAASKDPEVLMLTGLVVLLAQTVSEIAGKRRGRRS